MALSLKRYAGKHRFTLLYTAQQDADKKRKEGYEVITLENDKTFGGFVQVWTNYYYK